MAKTAQQILSELLCGSVKLLSGCASNDNFVCRDRCDFGLSKWTTPIVYKWLLKLIHQGRDHTLGVSGTTLRCLKRHHRVVLVVASVGQKYLGEGSSSRVSQKVETEKKKLFQKNNECFFSLSFHFGSSKTTPRNQP
jgi:hypothetical protein